MITSLSINSSISTASAKDTNGATYSGSPFVSFSATPTATLVVCRTSLTVNSSGTTFDLSSIADAFGDITSFATMVSLQVVNNGPTNSVLVGGGTNALFTVLPAVTAGGAVNLTSTIAITTNKNLKFASSTGTSVIDFIVVGTAVPSSSSSSSSSSS